MKSLRYYYNSRTVINGYIVVSSVSEKVNISQNSFPSIALGVRNDLLSCSDI